MALTRPTPPSPIRTLGDPRRLPHVPGFVTAGEALERALEGSPLAAALEQIASEIGKEAAE